VLEKLKEAVVNKKSDESMEKVNKFLDNLEKKDKEKIK